MQVLAKYGDRALYEEIGDLFTFLPLCTVVEVSLIMSILVIHCIDYISDTKHRAPVVTRVRNRDAMKE